eukprot:2568318-Pyramimonas_sp.AAC.2
MAHKVERTTYAQDVLALAQVWPFAGPQWWINQNRSSRKFDSHCPLPTLASRIEIGPALVSNRPPLASLLQPRSGTPMLALHSCPGTPPAR